MKIEELIKSIESERKATKEEIRSSEGLLRLQEVASQYEGEHRLIWSDELVKEIKDRPRISAHPTNIPKLDEIIGGFKEQQLITLVGSTGHGKTAFGMFLTEQLEEMNPVSILIEQSAEELITQRLDSGYHIPKFLTPHRLADNVTVDWIEQRVIEGIAKYNTKFVVIDHMGYIKDPTAMMRENLSFRIGERARSLKNVAKRWNVIILLLVHISQQDEQKPPTLQDIKNSSDIAQESDIVMTVWLKNEKKNKVTVYDNRAMVSVLKNRRTGQRGNVGLRFDTDTGRYEEEHGWVESMENRAKQEIEFDDMPA